MAKAIKSRCTTAKAVAGGVRPARPPRYMSQIPPLGPLAPFRFPLPRQLMLAGQTPALLLERDDLPLVSLRVTLSAGSTVDPADLPGAAYVCGQLLDEGAGERDALQLSADLLQIGAGLEIWTEGDSTAVALQVLRPHLEPALDILADLLCRPRLAAADWSRLRQELLGRVQSRRDQPEIVAQLALKRLIYRDHPYGRPLLPLPDQLLRLSLPRLRQFHRLHYRPERALVVAAGALQAEELRALWAERFGRWRKATAGQAPMTSPLAPRRRRQVLGLVPRSGAAQSVLCVGQLGPARGEVPYGALRLLNMVLGGSFTSRLNLNLRERNGFTYGVRSSFSLPRQQGIFSVRTSVQSSDTLAALAEIFRELQALRRRPVSRPELAKAKEQVLQELPQQAETLEELVETYSELAAYAQPLGTVHRLPGEVEQLTPAELQALAQQVLAPERCAVVVVGEVQPLAKPLERAYGKARWLDPDGQPRKRGSSQ